MRRTISIPLDAPLTTHDGPLKQIVLREPTFDEYLELGDPYTVAAGASGVPFAVENVDVIKKYIAFCLVEPKNPALLSQAGANVARALKETLLSFFQHGGAAAEASATSPTTSPSVDTASDLANSKN
jgi:hypothetical protein